MCASQGLVIWCLLIFLSIAIRLVGLEERDLWYDEAVTGVFVKSDWPEMIQQIVSDSHPPLYYFLLKIFSSPFEYSQLSLRLFSVFWGFAAIVALFFIVKNLAGRRSGVLAFATASFAPLSIYYSQEARMYSMLAALTLCAVLCLLKAIKTNDAKFYLLWGLFIGLSIATHYVAATIFVISIIIVFFFDRPEGKEYLVRLSGTVMGIFVSIAVYLPWAQVFMEQFENREEKTGWIPATQGIDVIRTISIFLFGVAPQLPAKWIDIFLFLVAGTAILYIFVWKFLWRSKEFFLIIFCGGQIAFLYILSIFGFHYFLPRYMITAAYFFYGIVGSLLHSFNNKLKILIGGLYLFAFAFIPLPERPEGFKLVIEFYNRQQSATLVALNRFDYVVAKYYLGEESVALYDLSQTAVVASRQPGIGDSARHFFSFDEIADAPEPVLIVNDLTVNMELLENATKNYQIVEVGNFKHIYLFKLKVE